MSLNDLGYDGFLDRSVQIEKLSPMEWRRLYAEGYLSYADLAIKAPISSVSYDVADLPDKIDNTDFLNPSEV